MKMKIKLKGCNCQHCREARRKNRAGDKLHTKALNKKIRQKNKAVCKSLDEGNQNFSIGGFYYA